MWDRAREGRCVEPAKRRVRNLPAVLALGAAFILMALEIENIGPGWWLWAAAVEGLIIFACLYCKFRVGGVYGTHQKDGGLTVAMTRMAENNPCRGCPERRFGCHEMCVEYLRYMAARKWLNERKLASNMEQNAERNRRHRIMRMFRKKGF